MLIRVLFGPMIRKGKTKYHKTYLLLSKYIYTYTKTHVAVKMPWSDLKFI